jgi:hypothetical protein
MTILFGVKGDELIAHTATELTFRGAVTLLIFHEKSSSFKRICHPDRSEAEWRDLLFTCPLARKPVWCEVL